MQRKQYLDNWRVQNVVKFIEYIRYIIILLNLHAFLQHVFFLANSRNCREQCFENWAIGCIQITAKLEI